MPSVLVSNVGIGKRLIDKVHLFAMFRNQSATSILPQTFFSFFFFLVECTV